MGDTELVNGNSGSSATSTVVRLSIESERHTDEHSPSRSIISGTVAHDSTSIILYSKRTAGSEDIIARDAIKDSRKHSESV